MIQFFPLIHSNHPSHPQPQSRITGHFMTSKAFRSYPLNIRQAQTGPLNAQKRVYEACTTLFHFQFRLWSVTLSKVNSFFKNTFQFGSISQDYWRQVWIYKLTALWYKYTLGISIITVTYEFEKLVLSLTKEYILNKVSTTKSKNQKNKQIIISRIGKARRNHADLYVVHWASTSLEA